MSNLRYLAGALALWLVIGPAHAECVGREQFSSVLAQRLPQAKVMTIEGAEARIFMAAFNRLPPATAFAAETVVIIDQAAQLPAVRFAFFDHGCLVRLGLMPRDVLRGLLAAISNSGA